MTANAITAEDRFAKLGIHLPDAPILFGAHVPAVQTGNLLFLSGMLATAGHSVKVAGMQGPRREGGPRRRTHGRAQRAYPHPEAVRFVEPCKPRCPALCLRCRFLVAQRGRRG
jgi:hypothetical protein